MRLAPLLTQALGKTGNGAWCEVSTPMIAQSRSALAASVSHQRFLPSASVPRQLRRRCNERPFIGSHTVSYILAVQRKHWFLFYMPASMCSRGSEVVSNQYMCMNRRPEAIKTQPLIHCWQVYEAPKIIKVSFKSAHSFRGGARLMPFCYFWMDKETHLIAAQLLQAGIEY